MKQENGAAVVIRRADRPGGLGWVLMAHAEIYREQLGWDELTNEDWWLDLRAGGAPGV